MIVKELFQKLDKEAIIDAYMFRHGYCCQTFEAKGRSLSENIAVMRNEREMVGKMINTIVSHDVDAESASKILFVFQTKSIFWDEKDDVLYESHFVESEEVKEKIKDASWKNDGDSSVSGYGYDFCSWKEILGFTIAKTSLKEVDPFEITSEVLNEMSFFGYEEEAHDETVSNEIEILNERMEEIQEKEKAGEPIGVKHEDVFAELEKRYCDSLSDEEKKYRCFEKEFEAKTEGIRHNYSKRRAQEYKEFIENYYKAEFLGIPLPKGEANS